MSNSLATVHPELVAEWSEKNLPLTPDKKTFGSNKIMWWKGACGHEWTASMKSRTVNGTGCPYCSHNKVLAGFNDLLEETTMREQKYHIYLNKEECDRVIHSLISLKNNLLAQGRYTAICFECKMRPVDDRLLVQNRGHLSYVSHE